jgi:hypothetical protein
MREDDSHIPAPGNRIEDVDHGTPSNTENAPHAARGEKLRYVISELRHAISYFCLSRSRT